MKNILNAFLILLLLSAVSMAVIVPIRNQSNRTCIGTIEFSGNDIVFFGQTGNRLGCARKTSENAYDYYDSGGKLVGSSNQLNNKTAYFDANGNVIGGSENLEKMTLYYDSKLVKTGSSCVYNGRTIFKNPNNQVMAIVEAVGTVFRPVPIAEADRLFGLVKINEGENGEEKNKTFNDDNKKAVESAIAESSYIVTVKEVIPGSPAYFAGMNEGDVIVEVGNWSILSEHNSKNITRRGIGEEFKKTNPPEQKIVVCRLAAGDTMEIVEMKIGDGEIGMTYDVHVATLEVYESIEKAYKDWENDK